MTVSIQQAIGNEMRDARLAAGLTQMEVVEKLAAERWSLPQPTLSRYEKGQYPPPYDLLVKLDGLYGLDPGTIFLRAATCGSPHPYKV